MHVTILLFFTFSRRHREIVTELIAAFHQMGVNMSLKIHCLRNHIDFFPEDMGKITDEHGERFHQTISAIESRYQVRADERMMVDFCLPFDINK